MAVSVNYMPLSAARALDEDELPPTYDSIFNNIPAELPPRYTEEPENSPHARLIPSNEIFTLQRVGASAATQTEEEAERKRLANGVFGEESVQISFIRMVYLIMGWQMLLTAVFIAFVIYNNSKAFVLKDSSNTVAFWFLITITVAVGFIKKIRLIYPKTVIFIFTLAEGFLLGLACHHFNTTVIFMAIISTAAMCLLLAVFGCKSYYGVLSTYFSVAPPIYLVYIWEMIDRHPDPIALAWVYVLVFLIINGMAYDLQLTIKNNNLSVLPHEYIFTVLSIYWNVIGFILVFPFCIKLLLYFTKNKSSCPSENEEQNERF